jgi:hypothetical protein
LKAKQVWWTFERLLRSALVDQRVQTNGGWKFPPLNQEMVHQFAGWL